MIHMEYYLIAIAIMINIYRNIRSIQVNKLDEMKW